MGSSRTIRELLDMVSKQRPSFVFIMETKSTTSQMERVRVRMGYEGLFCVDRVGLGGGLALFWRDSGMASLISFSTNHIDVEVHLPGKLVWRLTGFYGHPERSKRQLSWDLLRKLKEDSSLPWAVIGDFNDITSQAEKRGTHTHPIMLIDGFNTALNDCNLFDMGMRGNQFTWERGRGTDAWVEERLDRVVASIEWADLFGERIAHCGDSLWLWGGEIYNKFGKRIRQLRDKLKFLKESRIPIVITQFLEAEKELDGLLKQEEVFWKQRSKQLWLKHGDLNTKYFHTFASTRRRNNHLQRLLNPDNIWTEGNALNLEVLRYFNQIFQSAGTSSNIFPHVRSRISEEMNADLLQPFTIEEIKAALFSMAPEKSPGPDGMCPSFYQTFWPIAGHDLYIFIMHCFNTCAFPEGLNDTNIVLIPKKKVPERVSGLRPIALCNVAYKVLAKALANRMKVTLESIISPSQSAFVPDRLLTDNVIIASEIGHYLRWKSTGLTSWAALKLDMAKAYDRMEWDFLKGRLLARSLLPEGFGKEIHYLLTYLFSVLKDYLFCFKGPEARGDIHGVRIARGAPAISHLFFADDSLLFFKATSAQAQKIKDYLEEYSAASGQAINYTKSSLMFSTNTPEELRLSVATCVGVPESTDFGRYLGLPSVLGKNKTAIFRYLEQRIQERIGSWQHKFISRAGREVLIKSIAQALPIFTMFVFLLPNQLCDSIEKLLNRYWWSSGGERQKGIHWLSWARLSKPKKYGGMGFKRIHEFNIALLAKQGWRLLIKPDSLVGKLLKARYFPRCGFLEAQLGCNPSYIWRSILAGQQVLKQGVARTIGDGVDTNIWGWPWLADTRDPNLQTQCAEYLIDAKVSGLMDANGQWDVEVLEDLFTDTDVKKILATPTSCNYKDSWRWQGDIRGLYSVKHGYHLLTANSMLKRSSNLKEYGLEGDAHCVITSRKRLPTFSVTALLRVSYGRMLMYFRVDLCQFLWMMFFVCPRLTELFSWQQCSGQYGQRGMIVCGEMGFGWLNACGGFGAVIRDHLGTFVAAKSDTIGCVRDPLLAEAMAIKEALAWVKELGHNNLIIETDCLNFCLAFHSRTLDFSYVGSIIKQCRIIARDIGNLSVRHVKRSVNHVAHVLAKATGSLSVRGSWVLHPPDCIAALLFS
ncbi:uncharacterized protein LOC115995954 [Ipomoea triloba]|uniref:uncharacterized protein LOC115995954 n=1 Tax=Ipomoea triloba TaxID=35885 RepID=UPI00125D5036|nr:uncharacterized protein LOC115995954 [Ipomoea triloba]